MSQYATLRGKVESYILDAKGRVDGLLLDDNRQLKVPSRLRKHLTASVAVGSSIQAEVKEGLESSYGQQFEVHKWLNGSAHSHESRVVQGRVARYLVGKKGRLRGFILDDETQVRLPRSVRKAVTPLLRLNSEVRVEGSGFQSVFGIALKARKLLLNGATFEAG